MKAGDLTTLANVKAWLNTGDSAFPPGDDPLLERMITAASKFVLTYLSRDIVATDYTLTINGDNTSKVFTPQYPIIGVASLSVNGTTVAAATNPPNGAGFLFDKESIFNVGALFPQGFQNVAISYSAGYQSIEAATIPNEGKYLIPVASLGRPWVTDRGVKLASGTSMVKVTGTPVAGQYAITTTNSVFNYLFSAADAAAHPDVVITYGYCPEDLEQALIEMIGERYSTRERIGQVSKILAQQTVQFSTKDFNANIADVFNQYRNVVPI